jgi:hypothetical protein
LPAQSPTVDPPHFASLRGFVARAIPVGEFENHPIAGHWHTGRGTPSSVHPFTRDFAALSHGLGAHQADPPERIWIPQTPHMILVHSIPLPAKAGLKTTSKRAMLSRPGMPRLPAPACCSETCLLARAYRSARSLPFGFTLSPVFLAPNLRASSIPHTCMFA